MLRRLTRNEIVGVGMTSQRTRDRLIERLRDKGIADERVLEVMRHVPRHLFMDEALSTRAYEDSSLPIGCGQTISQPFVVARMTEALIADLPARGGRVLEIGTGSGYQAAVLAGLVESVHTVERIGWLLERARERFRQLELRNIHVKYADGHMGWPDQGPYDGIMLTAAPERVPDDLFGQLAPAGTLIAPVGGADGQRLFAYTRGGDNGLERRVLDMVSFVPFLGGRD
jgi:protein-L-isoaspartate(D-aspartate) O-methyltransferase